MNKMAKLPNGRYYKILEEKDHSILVEGYFDFSTPYHTRFLQLWFDINDFEIVKTEDVSLQTSKELFHILMDEYEHNMSGEDVDVLWRQWIHKYPFLQNPDNINK